MIQCNNYLSIKCICKQHVNFNSYALSCKGNTTFIPSETIVFVTEVPLGDVEKFQIKFRLCI